MVSLEMISTFNAIISITWESSSKEILRLLRALHYVTLYRRLEATFCIIIYVIFSYDQLNEFALLKMSRCTLTIFPFLYHLLHPFHFPFSEFT